MSNDRLPPADGEWIDRSRTLNFKFEGAACSGFAGDTLSSALWSHGVRMLGRSFKYHRPRGIYSMANHDVNAMFVNGARTNIRWRRCDGDRRWYGLPRREHDRWIEKRPGTFR